MTWIKAIELAVAGLYIFFMEWRLRSVQQKLTEANYAKEKDDIEKKNSSLDDAAIKSKLADDLKGG